MQSFKSPNGLDKDILELGQTFAPRFDENGLIAAIAQDAESGQILMFAYMNEEALAQTLKTGEVHYWSRSRKALWHKGATSGHIQKLVEIRTDCDQDVLLLRVKQISAACHQGFKSCFYRKVEWSDDKTRLSNPLETRIVDPDAVYGKS